MLSDFNVLQSQHVKLTAAGAGGGVGGCGGCKFDMLDHYSQEDTIAGPLVEMIQNNSKPKAKKLTY